MKYILPIIATIIIVIPGFNLAGLPIQFEDFFLVAILLFAFNESEGRPKIKREFSALLTLFFAFIISNFLSLLFAILRGYDYIFNDINTILLYLKSCMFLIGGYYLGSKLKKTSTNYILYSFVFGIFLSSIFGIVQYFDIAGLGRETYLLYAGERRIQYGINRAIGALNNPNYASYFHSIGFVIALNIQIITKKDRLIKYILLSTTFLGVVLTFSRTGVFVLLLVWFLTLLLNGKLKKLFSLAFTIAVVIIYFLDVIFQNTRFGSILEGNQSGNIANFGNRANMIWEHRFDSFFEFPLLGTGPAKNQVSGTVFGATIYDNVFLLLLVTSGLIGLVLYFLILYKMAKPIIQFKLETNPINNTLIPIYVLTLLFFVTTDLIWDIHFVSYFYLIVGVFYSYSEVQFSDEIKDNPTD